MAEVRALDEALAERLKRYLDRSTPTVPEPPTDPSFMVWQRLRPTNVQLDYSGGYNGGYRDGGHYSMGSPPYYTARLDVLVDPDDLPAFQSWLHGIFRGG